MRLLLTVYLFLGVIPLYSNGDIERLVIGNKRFAKGDYTRESLIAAQYPFCAVLACSDSRVAPELIFDQNLGDLFVVRLAGNVASPEAIDSLEFAVSVLKVDFIIVLGHQNCGAVNAVVQHSGDVALGAIASLIVPAIKETHTLPEAIIANLKAQMNIIRSTPAFQERVKDGSLKIMCAFYNFDTGLVTFFDE